ncbi:MAG: hypothetical protein HY897_12655 [Deltaproteobacteria bacterium]|nr:hypothetical protein [Deltaproteobacteria bacterium]
MFSVAKNAGLWLVVSATCVGLAAAAVAGCGAEKAPAGTGLGVSMRFASVDCPGKDGEPQSDGKPPADIKEFTITISGGGLGEPIERKVARGADDFIVVNDIPAGEGYTVTVVGTGGSADWKGEIKDVSFENGKKTEARVYLTRVDAFTCAPEMGSPRFLHAAAALNDGRVLITGGAASIGDEGCSVSCCRLGCEGDALKSTDIYDPKTGEMTRGPDMKNARAGHSATALADGRVVVAGGLTRLVFTAITSENRLPITNAPGAPLPAEIEIFDPETGRFSDGGEIETPRFLHAAAPAGGTKVILAGGATVEMVDQTPAFFSQAAADDVEIYDAGKRSVTVKAMRATRVAPAVATLSSGKVMVIGGGKDAALAVAEAFDPKSGALDAFTTLDCTPENCDAQAAQMFAPAVPLEGQKVLVRGGFYVNTTEGTPTLLPVDAWDAAVMDFAGSAKKITEPPGKAADPVSLLFAAAVRGSQVLICGGANSFDMIALEQCEVRDPAAGTLTEQGKKMFSARLLHAMTLSGDGTVLISGGLDLRYVPKVHASAEVYRMP